MTFAHRLADNVFSGSIGLLPDAPPLLTKISDAPLELGAIYSPRAGLIGTEMLWPSAS